MGSDDGFLGINGCILTYSPQIFRYSFDGQLIHDDFCITKVTAKAGTSVSFISKPHKIKKFIFAQFQVKSELCKPGNKNQIWDRIRPPNNIFLFEVNLYFDYCVSNTSIHTMQETDCVVYPCCQKRMKNSYQLC